ncbi:MULTISPECIES: MerR family transcriptional regulator [unclassified Nitrospina]|uniref:MerR family transcriptional regulator n=1 Tax=unclassified Nitrospina TaxID=2638683 RepID=UPI003F957C51
MLAAMKQHGNLLTIGELSKRTGISTHTLRMWEKRYESPQSTRLPSGHRRYLPEEVERLQVVARALKFGFRAGKVVGGTQEELNQLLGLETKESSRGPLSIPINDSHILDQCIDWIAEYDEENLEMEMHRQWGKRGTLDFVNHLAAPLISRIGQEWQEGNFTVAHEHFATEILNNFLARLWRRQNERKHGPTVVLATLSGESHILGLQMCAAVLSVTDWKIISLGLDVPEQEIAATVERCGSKLLCVSVSEWYGTSRAKPMLWRLSKQLGRNTTIVVGGGGAPSNVDGTEVISDFNQLYEGMINPLNG